MKPVSRYQTQLLVRKSYKPTRSIRVRGAKSVACFKHARVILAFRPARRV